MILYDAGMYQEGGGRDYSRVEDFLRQHVPVENNWGNDYPRALSGISLGETYSVLPYFG